MITFEDITERAGVSFRGVPDLRRGKSLATIGGGIAAADVDGDGWIDLFITGTVADGRHPGKGPRGLLYRNLGGGIFEERAEAAGIHDTGWTMGAHFADLDADGRPDLLTTAIGGNHYYHNRGEGRFEPAPQAGLAGDGSWSVGAAFLDANGDGRLDVYVPHYLDTDYSREQRFPGLQIRTPDDYEGVANVLWLQRADGTFRAAPASGAEAPGSKSLGAVALDADADGTMDLFIANDRTPNLLLRGLGHGTFEDAGAASGIDEISGRTGPRAGMGIAVGDADGDGDTDLIVTNFGGEPVTFYRNAGGGLFEEAAEEAGLAEASKPYVQWGLHLEDLDNDGDADLPIVSGHLVPRIFHTLARLLRSKAASLYEQGDLSFRQPAVLFAGVGGGRFQDVTSGSGALARMRLSARGSACADFDGDGRLDLAVNSMSGGVRVLRNSTRRAGHAIAFLPAPGGAGLAIGTRVAVTAGGRRQVREFGVVPSYASGSWTPLHFGLGAATRVDTVEVFAPGTLRPSAVLRDIAADRVYEVGPAGLRTLLVHRPRS